MTDLHDTPDDDRALIAEYVLGLLPEGETRSVEDRLARDATLRALHSDWADSLTALASGRDVAPPAALRAVIEARLFPQPARQSRWLGWLGLVAAPVAAFALAVVLLQPPAFEPVLHAEMEAVADSPMPDLHFAAGTDGKDLLILRRMGEPFPGRVIEIWMIPEDGVPRSLGVMPDQERLVIPAPEGLEAGVVLALSDEPLGGSPTGAPTGAVLAAGPLYDL